MDSDSEESDIEVKAKPESESVTGDTDCKPLDTEIQETAIQKYLDASRLNRIFGGGLRIALAAFVFFYLMEVWGIDVQFGKALARAAFKILVVVLICYVTWDLISAVIQRRLKKETPEDEDDEKFDYQNCLWPFA